VKPYYQDDVVVAGRLHYGLSSPSNWPASNILRALAKSAHVSGALESMSRKRNLGRLGAVFLGFVSPQHPTGYVLEFLG
jgi:hypothetical protein